MWHGDSCFPRTMSWAMKRSGTSSGEIDEDRSGGGTRDESPAPSAGSDFSIAPGDSEVSGSEGYASSDGEKRAPRRRARHAPVPAVAGRPTFTGYRSTHFNNRSDVGNIGIFLGNWGQRTQRMNGCVQKNIDAHIKKTMPSHWPD